MNRKTAGMFCVVATVAAAGVSVWLSGGRDAGDTPGTAGVPRQAAPVQEEHGAEPASKQATEFVVPLSEEVELLTRGAGVDARERMRLVRSLSRAMSGRDQEALMAFISGPCPEGCPLGEWHGMVDVVMNTLRRQHKAPAALTDTLVDIYRNSADIVLRDYAVQHMRSWYVARGTLDKHEARPEKQALILQTLLHAAGQKDKTFSGTALLALDNITTSPGLAGDEAVQAQLEEISGQLDQVVLSAATSDGTNKHCRIDALQLCARRGLEESLPTARLLAADKNADPSVRISAIALIGALGSLEEDEQLLKSVKRHGRRYEWAAVPALRKLSKKP